MQIFFAALLSCVTETPELNERKSSRFERPLYHQTLHGVKEKKKRKRTKESEQVYVTLQTHCTGGE